MAERTSEVIKHDVETTSSTEATDSIPRRDRSGVSRRSTSRCGLATTIARIDAVIAGDVCGSRDCWTSTVRAVSPWCSPSCALEAATVREHHPAVLLDLVDASAPPAADDDRTRRMSKPDGPHSAARPAVDPEPTQITRWPAVVPVPWWRRALAVVRLLPW